MAHLKGIGKPVIGHTRFSPGGLSKLGFVLFGGFMILFTLLLFGFEVEVGGVGEYFL